jgi:hypothetical protein
LRTLLVLAFLLGPLVAYAESGVPAAPAQTSNSIAARVRDVLFGEPARDLELARRRHDLEEEALKSAQEFVRRLCEEGRGTLFATIDFCSQEADEHHAHEKEEMDREQAQRELEGLAASTQTAMEKEPRDPIKSEPVVLVLPSYLSDIDPVHCRLDFGRMKDERFPRD